MLFHSDVIFCFFRHIPHRDNCWTPLSFPFHISHSLSCWSISSTQRNFAVQVSLPGQAAYPMPQQIQPFPVAYPYALAQAVSMNSQHFMERPPPYASILPPDHGTWTLQSPHYTPIPSCNCKCVLHSNTSYTLFCSDLALLLLFFFCR